MINISNHPSSKWSLEQLAAAGGAVEDIQFPNVPPDLGGRQVRDMAIDLLEENNFFEADPSEPVMVQGEFSLTFHITNILRAMGWTVVVACSERQVIEGPDGTKTAQFKFVQFREV